jgi:hypothetical protein
LQDTLDQDDQPVQPQPVNGHAMTVGAADVIPMSLGPAVEELRMAHATYANSEARVAL